MTALAAVFDQSGLGLYGDFSVLGTMPKNTCGGVIQSSHCSHETAYRPGKVPVRTGQVAPARIQMWSLVSPELTFWRDLSDSSMCDHTDDDKDGCVRQGQALTGTRAEVGGLIGTCYCGVMMR